MRPCVAVQAEANSGNCDCRPGCSPFAHEELINTCSMNDTTTVLSWPRRSRAVCYRGRSRAHRRCCEATFEYHMQELLFWHACCSSFSVEDVIAPEPEEGLSLLRAEKPLVKRSLLGRINTTELTSPRTDFTHFLFQHSHLSDTSKKLTFPWPISSCYLRQSLLIANCIVVLRSEIPSGICAKLRTVAASNNRVHMPWSLFAYVIVTFNCWHRWYHQRSHATITLWLLVRATYMYGIVLHAHPVRGESHNQRNTTGEVATVGSLVVSVCLGKLTVV